MRVPLRTSIAIICAAVVTLISGCSRAAQNASPPLSRVPAFDANRAFDLLKKQVELGPRVPGTPGHDACARLIADSLKPYADGVVEQEFSRDVRGKTLRMRNIIAHFNTGARDWVLLAAHWDTRPTADFEVSAEDRDKPIPGANDGASGVAVLLELARLFAQRSPDVGVLMVFFDGEDYGPTVDDMLMGSRHFAGNLEQSLSVAGRRAPVRYGILLDMVGDSDLKIYKEGNSVQAAPEVVDKVWSMAARMGYGEVFVPEVRHTIMDDHVPLIEAGIPCIDIIDFDYGPWHTLGDTIDRCSADSLKAVGEVVAAVIYEEKSR